MRHSEKNRFSELTNIRSSVKKMGKLKIMDNKDIKIVKIRKKEVKLNPLENGLKGNTWERNWTHLIRYRFVNNFQYLEV